MRLLLLHPSENHRWYIQQLLRESGHPYELASSSSLFDSRTNMRPTHILSAFRLLDVAGRELVESIRERWPGIPLLLLGDGLDQVQAQEMISAGANEFLVLEELTATVLWRSLQVSTIRAALLAQFPPKLLRSLINLLPTPLLLLRSHGPSLANRAFQVQLGYADWQLDDEQRLSNSLFGRDRLPGPGRHNLMCATMTGQRIPCKLSVEEFAGVRVMHLRLGLEQSAVTRAAGLLETLGQELQAFELQLQIAAGLALPVIRDRRQDLLQAFCERVRESCPHGSLLRVRIHEDEIRKDWVQLEVYHSLPGMETSPGAIHAVVCPESLRQQAHDLGAELDARMGESGQLHWTLSLAVSPGTTAETGSKGRILLMDDDDLVRRLLAQVLQRMGYTVDHAEDGERAIELFSKAQRMGNSYLLVVADLHTKGSGAQELLPRLRELDTEIRVLLVSGDATSDAMLHWKQQGFAAALRKPFNISELRSCLLRLLERDTSAAESPLVVSRSSGRDNQPESSK